MLLLAYGRGRWAVSQKPKNVKKKEQILHVANKPVHFVLLSDRFTVSYFHYYSGIPGLAFLYIEYFYSGFSFIFF